MNRNKLSLYVRHAPARQNALSGASIESDGAYGEALLLESVSLFVVDYGAPVS